VWFGAPTISEAFAMAPVKRPWLLAAVATAAFAALAVAAWRLM
jgi:hypothetical protein